MMHRAMWAVAIAAALAAAGCSGNGDAAVAGYRAGEQFDDSIRTVAVPIFENRSFYRETEFRLTEAITKEIESRTPWKVTAGGAADTILTGTIRDVEQRLLSRETKSGVAQEVQVRIVVSFEWKNLRTGEVLRQRGRFEASGEYIPTAPLGEPFEVARLAAIDEMAREIVSVMRRDW